VTVANRVRRRQLLREAEGYLDLIMLPSAKPTAAALSPSQSSRNRLALRALEILEQLELAGGTWRQSHLLYLRGQAYRVMHRFEEAVAPLEAANALAPSNVHICLALAWCFKRIDRLDRAIETLEGALQVDAESAIVLYNLACYWSLANNPALATSYLAAAFDIDQSYRDLVADESDFDSIRHDPEFQHVISVAV